MKTNEQECAVKLTKVAVRIGIEMQEEKLKEIHGSGIGKDVCLDESGLNYARRLIDHAKFEARVKCSECTIKNPNIKCKLDDGVEVNGKTYIVSI